MNFCLDMLAYSSKIMFNLLFNRDQNPKIIALAYHVHLFACYDQRPQNMHESYLSLVIQALATPYYH